MSKSELETQLNNLRQRWIGKVPKSNSDPQWWAFKCDSVIATRLKTQIANLPEINLQTAAELIFGPVV